MGSSRGQPRDSSPERDDAPVSTTAGNARSVLLGPGVNVDWLHARACPPAAAPITNGPLRWRPSGPHLGRRPRRERLVSSPGRHHLMPTSSMQLDRGSLHASAALNPWSLQPHGGRGASRSHFDRAVDSLPRRAALPALGHADTQTARHYRRVCRLQPGRPTAAQDLLHPVGLAGPRCL
jgi:hypothetical protein